jgi:hypothetical protein
MHNTQHTTTQHITHNKHTLCREFLGCVLYESSRLFHLLITDFVLFCNLEDTSPLECVDESATKPLLPSVPRTEFDDDVEPLTEKKNIFRELWSRKPFMTSVGMYTLTAFMPISVAAA